MDNFGERAASDFTLMETEVRDVGGGFKKVLSHGDFIMASGLVPMVTFQTVALFESLSETKMGHRYAVPW